MEMGPWIGFKQLPFSYYLFLWTLSCGLEPYHAVLLTDVLNEVNKPLLATAPIIKYLGRRLGEDRISLQQDLH